MPAKHDDDFEPEGDDPDVESEVELVSEGEDDEKPRKKKKSAPKRKAEDIGEKTQKKRPVKPKVTYPPPPQEPTTYEDGWTVHPQCVMYRKAKGGKPSQKVAGFDLDGTLIERKTGAISPADEHDFLLFNKRVVEKIKDLHEKGYAIVILSNQGGIKKAMLGALSTKLRALIINVIESIEKAAKCSIPIHVILATETKENSYRKPGTGMWDLFVKEMNDGVEPDLSSSFYVGDASGRPGDINNGASSDRDFALALGLTFHLPEQYFGPKQLFLASDSPNSEMAMAFNELARLVKEANVDNAVFKARAFQTTADAIQNFPGKITSSKDLKGIKGVGKKSLAKVDFYLEHGYLEDIQDLKNPKKEEQLPQSAAAQTAFKFI